MEYRWHDNEQIEFARKIPNSYWVFHQFKKDYLNGHISITKITRRQFVLEGYITAKWREFFHSFLSKEQWNEMYEPIVQESISEEEIFGSLPMSLDVSASATPFVPADVRPEIIDISTAVTTTNLVDLSLQSNTTESVDLTQSSNIVRPDTEESGRTALPQITDYVRPATEESGRTTLPQNSNNLTNSLEDTDTSSEMARSI